MAPLLEVKDTVTAAQSTLSEERLQAIAEERLRGANTRRMTWIAFYAALIPYCTIWFHVFLFSKNWTEDLGKHKDLLFNLSLLVWSIPFAYLGITKITNIVSAFAPSNAPPPAPPAPAPAPAAPPAPQQPQGNGGNPQPPAPGPRPGGLAAPGLNVVGRHADLPLRRRAVGE